MDIKPSQGKHVGTDTLKGSSCTNCSGCALQEPCKSRNRALRALRAVFMKCKLNKKRKNKANERAVKKCSNCTNCTGGKHE